MQILFGLVAIGSLEVAGESQPRATFKGKTIGVNDILTDVHVMENITCYAPDNSDFSWRSPGNCNEKLPTDYNVKVTKEKKNKTTIETLSFTAFVENGIFTCGGCDHSIAFTIYNPDNTTRDALVASISVLAALFVFLLLVALYAIRGKLRSEDALELQQRESQARRDTAIEDTPYARRADDGPPLYSPDLPQTDRRVLPAETMMQAGVWPSFRLAPRSAERREEVHALHSRACSASLRSQSPQAAPSPVGQAPAMPPPPPDSPPPQYKEDDDSETSV
ncbi:uncharacterized protein LOC135817405 isoform X2 [Sycon ciliatum]|uniref:uncharacterized protein LOC135817405 isoform X2 n=1 Tax=Sycon ciliatum TaxID=27933 RepID=UPI0020AE068A